MQAFSFSLLQCILRAGNPASADVLGAERNSLCPAGCGRALRGDYGGYGGWGARGTGIGEEKSGEKTVILQACIFPESMLRYPHLRYILPLQTGYMRIRPLLASRQGYP